MAASSGRATNRLRGPGTAFLLACVVYFACLILSAARLPEHMATHFDLEGRANGWMDRSTYLAVMALFGLLFPLVIPSIMFVSRYLPASAINLPNRDYWLGPERHDATMAYFFRHSLWLSALSVMFALGLHLLTLDANSRAPAQLSQIIWALAALFLIGVALWAWGLIRHFAI